MARPRAPESRSTSASTVGLPRESRTSRPITCSMVLTTSLLGISPGGTPDCKTSGRDSPDRGRFRPRGSPRGSTNARSRKACSASTPTRCARFAAAKSTTPTSRAASAASLERGSSACGSLLPARCSSAVRSAITEPAIVDVGSSPTARALRASFVVNMSAGSAAGMPSVTLRRSFSLFLMSSQFCTTCSAPSTTTSPKTWGCRWTSLSCTVRATSARVNSSASPASRAWKTIWNKRSPSSSWRCS